VGRYAKSERYGVTVRDEEAAVGDGLSVEEINDLLAARRRRYVLYCLYLYANPVQLADVADRVTEWEHGAPGEELLDERLRTYNDLYHTHVPRLADADVVAYHQSEDAVELARNAALLRPYLDHTAETDLEPTDRRTCDHRRGTARRRGDGRSGRDVP
jgi:hypothetical protein